MGSFAGCDGAEELDEEEIIAALIEELRGSPVRFSLPLLNAFRMHWSKGKGYFSDLRQRSACNKVKHSTP